MRIVVVKETKILLDIESEENSAKDSITNVHVKNI